MRYSIRLSYNGAAYNGWQIQTAGETIQGSLQRALSILANVGLCAVLTGPLGVAGLAVSSTVSSTLYAVLLLIPL